MAHFSFERSIYEIPEDEGVGRVINIRIENPNDAVIENIITLSVIVNTAESNATQGTYALDFLWCY